MKTTQTVLLLIFGCFLLSSTCGKDDPTCRNLQLDNKTDKNVYVLMSFDYPDTGLNFQSPFTNPIKNKIGPHSKGVIKDVYTFNCADTYFDYYPTDTLLFFAFDAALVDTTPWIKIRQNYQIMKRFVVERNEAVNNNYTLSLP